MRRTIPLSIVLTAGFAVAQPPRVVISGLQTPQRMILTAQGNFLVTEATMSPNTGRLSFVSRGGNRRSLMEGLPSGVEVTAQYGIGPTAMSLRDRTLYLTI